MTAGFYSPLPPAPTGVADYSAALLDALKRRGQVKVNAPSGVALYHLGNNLLHREIYEQALRRPGAIVLHDAVLNHFFLGTLDRTGYQEEFVFNYGEWMRAFSDDLWKHRARSAANPDYFEYPMLKRIAECAKAIIVHNPAAARMAKRHSPQALVVEIPHLFVPPYLPEWIEIARFRASLGISPRTLLVGVFGHLRESKRLAVIRRAFEKAISAGADARLLIAGRFGSSDLERAMEEKLADNRILRVGPTAENEFWRWAAATDLCLNLRFPTAGESSGIAIRMMGIGKPVIFTESEEIARIPENACLRVAPGAAEEETLAAYLVWLAHDRSSAAAIGERAAAYIRSEHDLDRAAERYWDVLLKIR